MNSLQEMLNHISTIRGEPDTEKRLKMLQELNDSLPRNIKLQMPSLITNAYVRKALDLIEERITVHRKTTHFYLYILALLTTLAFPSFIH